MYKLLIADDEAIERFAFRTIVSKEFPEIDVIGEAASGREAIKWSREACPDIIIMDIKMPGINGIEATRLVKEENKDVHVIVLTAYDNFEYVQEAIKIGVDDYILKPSKKERIIQVLSNTIDMIKKSREKKEHDEKMSKKIDEVKPIIENQLISSVIFGESSKEDFSKYLNFLDIDFPPGFIMFISFMEQQNLSRGNYLEEQIIKKKIFDYVYEMLHRNVRCAVGMSVSNSIIGIIALPEVTDEYKVRLYSIELANELQKSIKENFDNNVIIGIGRKFDYVKDIERSYQEAVSASRFADLNEEVRHFGDINSGIENSLQYPIQKEKMLLEKVRMLETGACRELIEEIFCWLFNNLGSNLHLVKTYIVGLVILIIRAAIENYINDETVKKFVNRDYFSEIQVINDICSLKKWFGNIVEEILNNVQYFHSNKLTGIVNKIKVYINVNYQKDITLEKAAEVVLLSPQHFSKAFKKETGMNFIDYLTEIRVEKSKELLANTFLNVKEISYNVGYNDPNYFFKVFKKITGITPGEYRSKFKGNPDES